MCNVPDGIQSQNLEHFICQHYQLSYKNVIMDICTNGVTCSWGWRVKCWYLRYRHQGMTLEVGECNRNAALSKVI
jgi:hypothetical protein